MARVRAGQLRHRITIQRKARVQDPETGAITEGWQDYITNLAASSTPSSVRQFLAAQQVNNELTGTFTIRYREDINASMRLLHKGSSYDILGLLPDADSNLEHITIMVKRIEGVVNG